MTSAKKKGVKKKTSRKRSSKYNKKVSLYGVDEKEILKELLKAPPMPKETDKGN